MPDWTYRHVDFGRGGEMAFFDTRVFHPFAKSNRTKSLDLAFRNQEKEKKKAYNQRVIEIEHGSFSPLVFGSQGGCGRETQQVLKNLIDKLAEKKDIDVTIIANYVYTKISFSLLRSAVQCIRGTRSYCTSKINLDEVELSTSNKNDLE